MKKRVFNAVVAGLVISSSVGLAGCFGGKDPNYTVYNFDNTYVVNETFSLEGAKLKIENSDGTFKEIAINDSMIKSMPDMTTAGTKTIVVEYDGKEYKLTIEVVAASIIDYEFSGYESSYFTTQTVNFNNLKLKLFYDNGTDETISVTPSMITTLPSMTEAGTKTVVVTHAGNEYSFTVSVVAPSQVDYVVTGYEDSYFTSDTFSVTNLQLRVNYNDGNHDLVDVTSSMIEQMPDMTVAGSKTVVINYNNKQYSFTINVVAVAETEYSFGGYESSYFVGDEFALNNLKLHINYNDGSSDEVNVTSSMIEQMPNMTIAGTKTIVVNYNGNQYSFTISVVEPSVTGYSVTGAKDSYFTNSTFSASGLTLTIEYNNNTQDVVYLTDQMLKAMPDMTVAGTKTVIVNYAGTEYQFTINVVAPKEVSRTVYGFEDVYDVNTSLDFSTLKLAIVYEDESKQDISITQNMIVEMPDMSTEGEKSVTVNYNGKLTTFSFEVKDFAKEAMLANLQAFMKDYNENSFKSSAIKISVAGNAKFLEDNAEFNKELAKIALDNLDVVKDYDIYRVYGAEDGEYIGYLFVKNFETEEEYSANRKSLNLFAMKYTVAELVNGELRCNYGSYYLYDIDYEVETQQTTFDEFQDGVAFSAFYDGSESICVFDSFIIPPVYNAIINSLTNATFNIGKGDIISAKEDLSAQLNMLKILNNLQTYVTSKDFYDYVVNDCLFAEDIGVYVNQITNTLVNAFEITNQNTVDQIEYTLTKILRKVKNNELTDIHSTYDLVVELNEILQASGGDASKLQIIDAAVKGIDEGDIHTLSKFVYAYKNLAEVAERKYGETESYEEATSGNRICTGSYNNGNGEVYQYYEDVILENQNEYIEPYYSTLRTLIERFENITEETDVKALANNVVSDLRALDDIVKQLETAGYVTEMINFNVTSSVRMAISAYVEAYDAGNIAGILDMLALAMPEGAEEYKVMSDGMYPALNTGDRITVEKTNDYKVGDIIVFNANDMKITYRILGIFDDGTTKTYICHGDNNASANPSTQNTASWQEDTEYVATLLGSSLSLAEIKQQIVGAMYTTEADIVGEVTAVNQAYVNLPANVIDLLQDCADLIYEEFKKPEIDYVALIEDICGRLEVEKDYYVEQYEQGTLSVFADLFDRYIHLINLRESEQEELYKALRSACVYMDSLFTKDVDRTEILTEINNCVKACLNILLKDENAHPDSITIMNGLVNITNPEQDFYTNLKDTVTETKQLIQTQLSDFLSSSLQIYDNETAVNELNSLINYHIMAYLNNEFAVETMMTDFITFVDKYCEEDARAYSKSFAMLFTLLINQGQEVDYNKMFEGVELPNQIKDVDFNTLIEEAMKQNAEGEILKLEDVKIDYVTDEEGNIVKEVLTISLDAKYDILLSSMETKLIFTVELNF